MPELFCGVERRKGESPTLYPVACAPQSWAAAAVFMLVEACLGMSVRAGNKQILLEQPCLPEGLPQLSIKGLRVGEASVDLFFERQARTVKVQVTDQQGELEVLVS